MGKAYSRDEVVERLLQGYTSFFDIERVEGENSALPLTATCFFTVHSEKYVLVKQVKLWTADCSEYVYIFSAERLTKDLYEKCFAYAYEDGMKRIQPGPGHMYSYITPVFVCTEFDEEARKALRKSNVHKSFRFSWYGWMNVHTAGISLKDSTVFTNRMGRENMKFLKQVLGE